MTGLANGFAKADWHRPPGAVCSAKWPVVAPDGESIKLCMDWSYSGSYTAEARLSGGWLMVQVSRPVPHIPRKMSGT